MKTPASSDAGLSIDLTACDRERIQYIAAVQPHGGFVSMGSSDLKVHHSSANVGELFSRSETEWKGRRLRELVGEELATEIQDHLRARVLQRKKHHAFEWRGDRSLDVHLYEIADGMVAAEFEPLPDPGSAARALGSPEESVTQFIREMKSARTIEDVGSIACRAVRSFTGLERVMLYRFHPETWEGEVVAEDRVAGAHSYFGHRFPATDIPKPARDLYLRNQVRFIFDSHASASEVRPKVAAGSMEPIDLSDSRLRAVSPVHLAYLRNMGVRSSFSLAVTVENRLWGLIACHHPTPLYVSHSARSLCETIANTLALVAPLLERDERRRNELALASGVYEVFRSLRSEESPLDTVFRKPERLLSLFSAEGMAFVSGTKVDFVGTTPVRAELQALAEGILGKYEVSDAEVFETDSLSRVDPRFEPIAEQVSGVLAVIVPEPSDGVFMLFRPERIRTIRWGGDPRKTLAAKDFQGPINPRVSFETWTETVRGASLPWMDYEVAGIENLRAVLFEMLVRNERLAADLRAAMSRRSENP